MYRDAPVALQLVVRQHEDEKVCLFPISSGPVVLRF